MFNPFQKPSAKDFIYIKSAAAVQEARMWLLGLSETRGGVGARKGETWMEITCWGQSLPCCVTAL